MPSAQSLIIATGVVVFLATLFFGRAQRLSVTAAEFGFGGLCLLATELHIYDLKVLAWFVIGTGVIGLTRTYDGWRAARWEKKRLKKQGPRRAQAPAPADAAEAAEAAEAAA